MAALAEAIRRTDRPDAGEPLDVRRSIAVGLLADPEQALTLLQHATAASGQTTASTSGSSSTPGSRPTSGSDSGSGSASGSSSRKQKILLTCHLTGDDLTRPGSNPATTDDHTRPWLTTMIQDWAGRPDLTVTVRPLLHCGGCADCHTICTRHADPDAHHYTPTTVEKELTRLRDPRCVFPYCTMPAARSDCDHVVPWDPDHPEQTPTCPRCNLAPFCRHHHRLKTHAGWRYHPHEPGTHHRTEPHGQQFLTTRWGTTDLTDANGHPFDDGWSPPWQGTAGP